MGTIPLKTPVNTGVFYFPSQVWRTLVRHPAKTKGADVCRSLALSEGGLLPVTCEPRASDSLSVSGHRHLQPPYRSVPAAAAAPNALRLSSLRPDAWRVSRLLCRPTMVERQRVRPMFEEVPGLWADFIPDEHQTLPQTSVSKTRWVAPGPAKSGTSAHRNTLLGGHASFSPP